MTIYTFSDSAISKLATKKTIAIYPLIIAMIFSSFLIANKVQENELIENTAYIILFSGVGLFFLIAGFFSAKKGAKTVFVATKYLIDNTSVEKQVPNAKHTKVSFRDIKSYRETKNGFRLRAMKKQIFIPVELSNYQELVGTIKKNTQSGVINYSTKFKLNEYTEMNLAGFGMLALLVSFFVIDNKQYKLLLGIPLLLILIYAIYDAYTNKHTQTNKGLLGKVLLYTLILLGYLIYIFFRKH